MNGPDRSLALPVLGKPHARAAFTVPGALALTSATAALLEAHVEPANLITIYLAGVVWVALHHGWRAALVAIFGSIALFDLLFVGPRWSLKPADPQYLLTFAIMTVVGLLVSFLGASLRARAQAAQDSAERERALNRLALKLARIRSNEGVAHAVAHALRQLLGIEVQLLPADAPPNPAQLHVRLRASSGTMGLFAVAATAADALSATDRATLESVASQAAIALERTLFEQRSADAAVQAEAERLRSTLLTAISHDLRTPLTTIIGTASTLLDQGHAIDDEQRRALLGAVLTEAQRLHVLTSNLLDLTRMEAGAVRPQPEWCPADELLEEARAIFLPQLAGRQLLLDAQADALVWCDPRLLGQALLNLIDNALRHSPAGGTVRASIQVEASVWHLVVQDQGHGLAPGEEELIFQKFYRGGGAGRDTGSGLGLAICAIVASLHGGRIEARNDGGARFEMSLPLPAPPTGADLA